MFAGQDNFRKLRRNPVLSTSERKYIKEREGVNAVKQSKNSIIFPGISKAERIKFSEELWVARGKSKDYIPPTDLYFVFVRQTAAYLIANTNPYLNKNIDWESIECGITWFLAYTYKLMDDLRDVNYFYDLVHAEVSNVKFMGYKDYLKNIKENFPDMFVEKVRFRCLRKVKGERRCDTARKERTSFKIETLAMYILGLMKNKKDVHRYMTEDGKYKKTFLEKVCEFLVGKFGGTMSIRRARSLADKALEFLGTTKEQVMEEGVKYQFEIEEVRVFAYKIVKRFKKSLSLVFGPIADVIFKGTYFDALYTMNC